MVKSFEETRTGECLKHLPPIQRACAGCDKLYECVTGREIVFGDSSITKKVIEYNYIETDVNMLKNMSLDQLLEYNAAQTKRELMIQNRKKNSGLTAGAYDREKDAWVTDVLTGEDGIRAEGDSISENLTAGYWDSKKKRWVAKT